MMLKRRPRKPTLRRAKFSNLRPKRSKLCSMKVGRIIRQMIVSQRRTPTKKGKRMKRIVMT